jgi:two-component system, NarL family, nitrate/nitrite response regulator NarL
MQDKPITVVAVDDHALILEAIRTRLSKDSRIQLVAEGTAGEQTLPLVAEHRPDILLLDLRMPQVVGDKGGYAFPYLDTIARLRQLYPETGIIVLSQYAMPEEIAEIAQMGVKGYLLKGDATSLNLVEIIQSVQAGQLVFSPRVAEILETTPRAERVNLLTARQREVLFCKLKNLDKSNRELAAQLHISESAFKGHLTVAYRILGLKNTAEAAAYYVARQQAMGITNAAIGPSEATSGQNGIKRGL